MNNENNEFLLVCDIGNSNAKFGIILQQQLNSVFRLSLERRYTTSDSLGLMLSQALEKHGITYYPKVCIAASVCPDLNSLLIKACYSYLNCKVLFAGQDFAIPMENNYERPEELGIDRLVAAYGARMFYPDEDTLLIVDFGSAITFDCVHKMCFKGGLIFPGVDMSLTALTEGTSKLPYVDMNLDSQDNDIKSKYEWNIPSTNTISCIRNGILLGYAVLCRGLCQELDKRMNNSTTKIATGGKASLIAPIAGIFDYIKPNLILNTLAMLYKSK